MRKYKITFTRFNFGTKKFVFDVYAKNIQSAESKFKHIFRYEITKIESIKFVPFRSK